MIETIEKRKTYKKRTLKCISNNSVEDFLQIGKIYNSIYDYIWDTYAIKINEETLLFKKEFFEEVV